LTKKALPALLAVGWAAGGAAGCATGDDPCDPNPCTTPPVDTCNGAVALLYPGTGACDSAGGVVECTYTPAENDCGANGQYCHQGQCLSDPCSPNPCDEGPADACDGDVLVSYEDTGTCEAVEGEVECSYGEANRLDCADSGMACIEGECQTTTDPCSPNPCDSPPADFCTDDVASIHPATGTCAEVGGSPECTYTPAEVDCGANGLVCQDGACVSLVDPCDPNPCTSPPADTCSGDVATQYPSTGTCTDSGGSPSCDYSPTTVDCTLTSQQCQGGLCVNPGDPCDPNPCTNPPADDCTGDTANHYGSTGTCTDSGGSPSCDYSPTPEDCTQNGQICSGGVCVTPQSGGLIISEYVEGPSYEKYLELYNASSSSINLDQFQLKLYSNGNTSPSSTDSPLPSVVLLPGDTYVIAHSSATSLYGSPDHTSSTMNFNGNDAVVLLDLSDNPIDAVGVVGDNTDYGTDTSFYRNSGIVDGVATNAWTPTEWTEVPDPTNHTLGSHTP
jgi:hypothetical protein